jgi:hypothetical protein
MVVSSFRKFDKHQTPRFLDTEMDGDDDSDDSILLENDKYAIPVSFTPAARREYVLQSQ